jgi:hypothetical protein
MIPLNKFVQCRNRTAKLNEAAVSAIHFKATCYYAEVVEEWLQRKMEEFLLQANDIKQNVGRYVLLI